MITDTDAMHIDQLCKNLQNRFDRELKGAKDQGERTSVLTTALYEYAAIVFPALDTIAQAEGAESPSYKAAQAAAVDLFTWFAIPYVRACDNFRRALTVLEEVEQKCTDPHVRRKLVTYTNQIKTQWNKVEPGGLHYNPRAAKRHKASPRFAHSLFSSVLGIVALFVMGFALFNLDFVDLIFGKDRQQLQQMEQRHKYENMPGNVPMPTADEETIGAAPIVREVTREPLLEGPGTYKFVDNNGVIHFVDHADKIPPEYRAKATVLSGGGQSTPVKIINNQVLVPVTIRNGERTIQTLLLLDTGCTVTAINQELAGQLNVDWSRTRSVTARLADGREVGGQRTKLELTVGSRTKAPLDVDIINYAGPRENHSGLLGMNYLRNFRYHIDFERQQLVWH